jgi:hypothetical protein
MAFDPEAVHSAVTLDPATRQALRAQWSSLMDLVVWGEIKSSQIGLLPKLRKRVLDLGEKLRSYAGDRRWIPHPREQIKNALSGSLQARDALDKVTELVPGVDGGSECAAFHSGWDALRRTLEADIAPREARLVSLLDAQYQEEE